ncbi:PRP1 splicing factor, N-terminal-domain-containing protein [Dunaliella salina]|uniref:PRP1 splicing factor, N-terminal-domain-containing protein n=1 Tax=Dunaliella salina TaxID=3046 RepID=A0ABQ7H2I1_DUNSA|nr:PRP1 splicing factor, N-terminal-domain-containing protein [Dunaliella salina]|eukprot:KAF5841064.1 PRP1 splicing factor, N-terminal-domain-containing protein [Dunaliella salina]
MAQPPPRVPIIKAKVEASAPGSRVNWNAVPAPSNYVPGLGRGATGFTTRSDIGPARPGAGPGGEAPGARDDQGKEGDVDDNKFDEFMGNDAGERGGERREKRLKEEIERYRAENPKITEQFADLKRQLAEVKPDEWEAIPDIGDYTIKKRKTMQSFVPVPDTLLSKATREKEHDSTVKDMSLPGLATPMGGANSTVSDLTAIGEGRGTVLELKLDRMADSVTGQTVGYLTDLKSMTLKSDADIADIKKARLLLKSVIQTNPNHAPGWVAIARLEELAGNMVEARKLMQEACERCPKSEDVWLEGSRLYAKQNRENAKAVLARGVSQIPDSTRLWTAAAALETDKAAQLRVLKKALERVPYSVSLWKHAIELVDEEDAKVRAVLCVRLSVLNRARKALPAEQSIWITAAQLEEANGNAEMSDKIVSRAIKALEQVGVIIHRDTWLGYAEQAERSGYPATSRSLVRAIACYNIDEEDKEATLLGDADEYLKHQPPAVEVARTLYAMALEAFPGKEHIWRSAAQLEMSHGSTETVENVLRRAVQYCPQAEVLWLMAAKHKWRVANDVAGSRRILEEAFAANPDSEEIWLAAFKLEFENDEVPRARLLLSKARSGSGAQYPRVWMKSAIERALLEEGIRRFPTFEKHYLMLGQLEEREGHMEAARTAYRTGLGRCMTSVPLWTSAARLEESMNNLSKARALLEQGRLRSPKNEWLWLASLRMELRAGHEKAAETILAKALQECPTSGVLLSEAIRMAPRPAQKAKSTDALKKNAADPYILATVADLFWRNRKVDNARSWFKRSLTSDPKIGDHWAAWLRFELQFGNPDTQAACVEVEPNRGELWCRVAKNPKNAHDKVEVLLKKVAVEQAAQEKHAGDVRLDVKDGPAGQDTKTNMKAEAKLEWGGPVKMEQD